MRVFVCRATNLLAHYLTDCLRLACRNSASFLQTKNAKYLTRHVNPKVYMSGLWLDNDP